MANELLQSTAFRCVFKAFLTGTNTPATGKTIAVTLSKNGGAFGNPSAGATNATEIASGWYYFDGSTTDANTLGDLVFRGTEGAIDPAERLFRVVKATNRGMTGIPDAAADAAGGLPISDAGGLDLDAQIGTDIDALVSRLTALRAGYLDNLSAGAVATAAQITSLNVNTRANLNVPVEIETPDASTQVYKVRLHLFDVEGNMEDPDSTPTVALTNAAGTDRSSRLSVASHPSTGVYTWDYTATSGDTEEQLVWVFTVVEGSLSRVYPATSYVVEESAYRFSSTDRANLGSILSLVGDVPTNAELATALAAADDAVLLSVAAVKTVVDAIKLKTDNLPGSPAATGAAMTLTVGERDAVAAALLDLTNGIEASVTLRKAVRGMAAVLCGDSTGANTTAEAYKAVGNSGTTRVTPNADEDGNRTGVTLNL